MKNCKVSAAMHSTTQCNVYFTISRASLPNYDVPKEPRKANPVCLHRKDSVAKKLAS